VTIVAHLRAAASAPASPSRPRDTRRRALCWDTSPDIPPSGTPLAATCRPSSRT